MSVFGSWPRFPPPLTFCSFSVLSWLVQSSLSKFSRYFDGHRQCKARTAVGQITAPW